MRRLWNKQLGRNDRNKMDEYLTGVREIEQRIERAERFGPPPDPGAGSTGGWDPERLRGSHTPHDGHANFSLPDG
jgi:hypothetical protein